MRSDMVPGSIFPDYELPDHTTKRRELSELQGQHPMVLVLSRGGFCPEERRVLVESNQFDSAIDYPACHYHVSCLWTCVASFKVDKPTEFDMSSTRSESAIESSRARTVDMELEGRRHPCFGRRSRQALLWRPRLEARRRLGQW
jgi:peroxiredoxin